MTLRLPVHQGVTEGEASENGSHLAGTPDVGKPEAGLGCFWGDKGTCVLGSLGDRAGAVIVSPPPHVEWPPCAVLTIAVGVLAPAER